MKMSWGNCYVKVSWGAPFVEVSFPHGDLHDEPEGVAPGRPGQGRPRRTHHQSARSHESAAERPAISAVEAPLRDGRGRRLAPPEPWPAVVPPRARGAPHQGDEDRKSTRLNSSHSQISYAVFCLKKKKKKKHRNRSKDYVDSVT